MVARDLRPFFFSEEPEAPFRALQVRGFLFFIFVFKIYKNISRPPRCRAAGIWSPRCGAAGAFVQKLLLK